MLRSAGTLAFVVLAATGVRAADITACGQSVPAGRRAVLGADLTCPPGAPAATVGEHATLALNGHTIHGGGTAVLCTGRRCTIEGPGEITGATRAGVAQRSREGKVVLRVRGVRVHGNHGDGIALAGDQDG